MLLLEDRRALRIAAACFVAGIVVFYGSRFAHALGAPRGLGAATPFGGVAFLAGWIAVVLGVGRGRARDR
jgi:uncharacterized membrane protein YgdD (TMEM256/DUF423 family)